MENFDVLIIGAGISGIGSAYHLQDKCPGKTYAILESRDALGGTWDLFRYPGVRSDSDMYTLGFSFKPWCDDKSIALGDTILDYVREAATENNIVRHIRFGHRMQSADWDSNSQRWTVTAEHNGEAVQLSCTMLLMCSGYYNYDEPHAPQFAGQESFAGTLVHPQHWPTDLDYQGKRVIVIGSGAAAMTLVPAMAEQAEHVTMVQRSPTYVVSR
ncbi:MAG: FAD-containing monooxygenase EthA, partial [Gammaproteobacteria bacterium]|nr:FAD-containing monooxygenase EthA [Gammaproteobacteria bacterium]